MRSPVCPSNFSKEDSKDFNDHRRERTEQIIFGQNNPVARERMKSATSAQAIFFKGLLQYLKDKKLHAPKHDEEIYDEFVKLIDSDAELTQIKNSVEFRAGLMGETSKRKK